MSTSQFLTTHDGYIFVCGCAKWLRRACNREIFYKEHGGKRYCVLHYPGIEKREDFQKALKQKLSMEDCDFRGVWFPDDVSFEGLSFSADAFFNKAHFSGIASFRFTEFSGTVDFSDVQFGANAFISNTSFNAGAIFSRAQFDADAYFTGAKFRSSATFSDAQFSTDVYFNFANFSARTSFRRAVFTGNSYFRRTTFIENSGSSSGSVVNNIKAISDNAEDPTKVKIFDVSFDGARFKDGVSFEESKFAGQTLLSFAAAVFEKTERVTFHTVALRPHWFVNVDSRKLNLINVYWGRLDTRDTVPKEIKALESNKIANASSLLAITFRQLAVNAEENNRYEEAANFRYMAMDMKRIERGFIKNVFSLSWWYWALSGYGERVNRAFGALLVIWFLFAGFYLSGNATWWQTKQANKVAVENNVGDKQPSAVAQPLTIPDSLIYSVSVMALQKPEPLPANKRAKGLVLLETILGPLQAALLALAIRRKFMR